MVVVADKGPFNKASTTSSTERGGHEITLTRTEVFNVPGNGLANLDPDDHPRRWRRGNSPNHGGRGNGEGQNVYRIDGSCEFAFKPAVGIDDDNIYTHQAQDEPGTPWRGDLPGVDSTFAYVLLPGMLSLGELNSSTDAFLWP